MPPKKKTKVDDDAVVIPFEAIQPNDAIINAGPNGYSSTKPHSTPAFTEQCRAAAPKWNEFGETMKKSEFSKARSNLANGIAKGLRLLKKTKVGFVVVSGEKNRVDATKSRIAGFAAAIRNEAKLAQERANSIKIEDLPKQCIVIRKGKIDCDDESLVEDFENAVKKYGVLKEQMSSLPGPKGKTNEQWKELDDKRHNIAKVCTHINILSNLRFDIVLSFYPLRVQKNFVAAAKAKQYSLASKFAKRATDSDDTDSVIIVEGDDAAQAIFAALSSATYNGNRISSNPNEKRYASFSDLLEDSSEKADATIKAMNNKIDPARLLTCSNSSDGSLAVLDIASIVNKKLDMSSLPSNLSPFSQTLGCTETTFAGTAYPNTQMSIDNLPYHVKLHQLKCRLENGARPKSIGEKKGVTSVQICV